MRARLLAAGCRDGGRRLIERGGGVYLNVRVHLVRGRRVLLVVVAGLGALARAAVVLGGRGRGVALDEQGLGGVVGLVVQLVGEDDGGALVDEGVLVLQVHLALALLAVEDAGDEEGDEEDGDDDDGRDDGGDPDVVLAALAGGGHARHVGGGGGGLGLARLVRHAGGVRGLAAVARLARRRHARLAGRRGRPHGEVGVALTVACRGGGSPRQNPGLQLLLRLGVEAAVGGDQLVG